MRLLDNPVDPGEPANIDLYRRESGFHEHRRTLWAWPDDLVMDNDSGHGVYFLRFPLQPC